MIFNMQQGGVTPEKIQGATTITPSTANQTVNAGTYLSGNLTVTGDADLVAGNIRKGKNIFGVAGTFEHEAEPDLIPNNIRKDVNILGVVGNMLDGIDFSMYGPYSKVEVVTFTPSANTYLEDGVILNHSLEDYPRFFIVVSPDASEITAGAVKELLGLIYDATSSGSKGGYSLLKSYNSGNKLLYYSYKSLYMNGSDKTKLQIRVLNDDEHYFQAGATYNAILVR